MMIVSQFSFMIFLAVYSNAELKIEHVMYQCGTIKEK